ncbi:Imm32 family immunity protein [Streptomyces caniscabiei]|uniref:Imm32 family immunity protein n=1 Tax=Streptomyces caniscabiei TaxID=2746961 RepID=UPI003AF49FD9
MTNPQLTAAGHRADRPHAPSLTGFPAREGSRWRVQRQSGWAVGGSPQGAQDGTPNGAHLHLEEHNGLEEGSAALVLERCDNE